MNRLRARGDSGAVAIVVALLMPVFIGITAVALDLGRVQMLGWELQKAADAAALAGAVYLPTDPDGADQRARSTVLQNYPGATVSSLVVANHPTQLQVTVSAPITYNFALILGFSGTTVTRVGVGEYAAPAPMGSPCNSFGNEPLPGSNTVSPTGRVPSQGSTGAFSNCGTPQLWAEVEGPDVSKVQGDRYSTRNCDSGPGSFWNCSGTNSEFKPEGYFYSIQVRTPGTPTRLQLYDPAFVSTGQKCGELPSSGMVNGMNNYVNTDAATRYDNIENGFCTGDSYPSSAEAYSPNFNQKRSTITSFVLREATIGQAPIQGNPVVGCAAQFRGWTTAPTVAQLTRTNGAYDADLARVFHQWYELCQFTPQADKFYFLQIRTNVSMPNSSAIVSGLGNVNQQLLSKTPSDSSSVRGDGANGFSMRADSTAVSIAGYERMSMYINSPTAATFNLIRADASAAGKVLVFSFFDAADAAGTGTFRVLPPGDGRLGAAAWTSIAGCTGQLNSSTTLTNLTGCTASATSAQNNGQLYTVYAPIPANYTCDTTIPNGGGCWFQVTITFASGDVHDVTTWDASIQGDPVRLVP